MTLHSQPSTITHNDVILVALLIGLLFFFVVLFYDGPQTTPYPTEKYEPQIPKKVFQTWHNKNLPYFMRKNNNELKRVNNDFQFFLFDDNDCRRFIEKHFSDVVVDAYDRLVPGAYRADLWRYCVLYIEGGIYLDIKFRSVGKSRLSDLTSHEHYVMDLDGHSIYQALMVMSPRNPLLLMCIARIINNVNNNFYGTDSLHPTGPRLLGDIYSLYHQQLGLEKIDMKNLGQEIQYNDKIILEHYPEYRFEYQLFKKTYHYNKLWLEHNIYKNKIK